MDRKTLRSYRKNIREIVLINRALDRLKEQTADVPTQNMDMKDRIREKESRKEELQAEIKKVEEFVGGLPEGIDKLIFELTYLEGEKQWKVAEAVGFSRGRVTQIIGGYIKD